MIKLKSLIIENNLEYETRMKAIPINVKMLIGKKIEELRNLRRDLHQGHSGHAWNAMYKRSDNIEKMITKLGFSNIRDESGDTEIDKAQKEIEIFYLRSKSEI